jgi:hypothetical protein
MTSSTKQFLALPLAVVGEFFASAVVGALIVARFSRWEEPFVGPLCATSVVVTTFWLAPAKKRTSGLIVLLLGILGAWALLRHSSYPEGFSKAYQPTIIPLVATTGAGVLSYICCCLLLRRFYK